MEEILVNNIRIGVIRKDIKNIHLAVYPPTGRVRLAAPLMIDEDAIRLFAISKLGWIKRNQRKFEEQARIPAREYKQRESHYFQGRRYLLNIVEIDKPPKIVLRKKFSIDLFIRPNSTLEKKQQILNNWYRKQMKLQVLILLEKWEALIGVKVDYWQIKQMKTKWGTCNIEQNKIWFNLELSKKPLDCLEYIVVHELIHLLERHHNEKFLYYMNAYLPNWKLLKKKLNQQPISHSEWTY